MSNVTLPEDYAISDDPARLNLEVIHRYLAQSYWAKDIPIHLVERMVKNSLCFGVYRRNAQIGFARIISDYATFAYLADVFILPEHRGQGLSKALMATILAHSDLQGLRRWMLVTLDAHGLYEQVGFKPLAHPERHLEKHFPGLYEGGGAVS